MRLTTTLMFALVFMMALCVTKADDLDCMCMCCQGQQCRAPDLPMFPLASCTEDSCKTQCVEKHKDYCTDPGSTPGGMCMAAASHVFNRYSTVGAFIIALIATSIFRI